MAKRQESESWRHTMTGSAVVIGICELGLLMLLLPKGTVTDSHDQGSDIVNGSADCNRREESDGDPLAETSMESRLESDEKKEMK